MSLSFLSPALALAVADQAPCGLLLADGQGVRFVNAGLRAMLGLPDALDARSAPAQWLAPHSLLYFDTLCRRIMEGGERTATAGFVAFHSDGGLVEVDAELSRVEAEGAAYLLVLVHNVTGRSIATRSLSRLAFHDSLTGLPNRALFLDRLNQTLRWSKRHRSGFALMCIDLDGFKAINDTHGHDMGDAVLREVADLLQNIVRESDTVARLGGDEFAILMQDADGSLAALTVAEHIHSALDDGLRIGELSLSLGASVGIAAWPQHGDDMHSLIAAADSAMFDAKRRHKGTSRYVPDAARPSSNLSQMMLNWTRDLESGVAQLDHEHHGLLDSINRMVAAFSSAEELPVIQDLLDQFVGVAERHFGNEEAMMSVLDAAERTHHQLEHRQALAELKRLRAALELSGISQTIQFVTDWLYDHVRHADRRLSQALLQEAGG